VYLVGLHYYVSKCKHGVNNSDTFAFVQLLRDLHEIKEVYCE
jgi:hypothetical protein